MFETLRQGLATKLKHSGEQSIVHLVAEVGTAVTGQPFRVLHAGPQEGADAVAGTASIEVKRYKAGSLGSRQLQGHIVQAAGRAVPAEVWVLVATVALSAQTRADSAQAGRTTRVHVALLDWAPEAMPAMLVLLASAPDVACDWLAAYAPDLVTDFQAAVRLLNADPTFPKRVESLIREVVPAFATFESARRAVREAYLAAYADPAVARSLFGQELTPLRPGRPLVERHGSLAAIDDALLGLARKRFLLVLGDEGVGKSWVVADYWRRHAQDHLMLFLPSATFANASHEDMAALLDGVLCNVVARSRPSKEVSFAALIDRWRRVEDPGRKVILVLDGLNERPSASWYRIINDLRTIVDEIGGRLVVTCRPRFWHRELADRVGFVSYETVVVEGFDDEEFAEAMRQLGRDPDGFPPELRGDLINPRIFNLAIDLLGQLSKAGLVTKERVLWEYWRHRSIERENVALSNADFRALLIRHAGTAFDAIRAGSPALARIAYPTMAEACSIAETTPERILVDLHDVATGRFFQPSDDPDNRYFTFVPDKLWYALGLRLAYMARDASDLAVLRERTAALIEPFSGMDVAADIVAAAFAVAALNPGMPSALAAQFLQELIDLRNKRSGGVLRFRDRVLAFVDEVPDAYIDVAERSEDPLIVDALRRAIAVDGSSRSQVVAAIGRWLNHEAASPHGGPTCGEDLHYASVNLFLLALRALGGLPASVLRGLACAKIDDREAQDLNWARWHRALDETGDPADLFAGALPDGEPPAPQDEVPAAFTSNEHVRFIVEQWLGVADADAPTPRADDGILASPVFDAPWNLSLAPSFLAWLPVGFDEALAVVHNSVASGSDPGEALMNLVEARVLVVPTERRVDFLLLFERPLDAEATVFAPEPVLRLGAGVSERYLDAAMQGRRSSGGVDETLCFALDFLRRVTDFAMDDEGADAIASLVLDRDAPASSRACALDLALQSRDPRVVRRLVESGWCPTDEPQMNMSLHGSDLLVLSAHEPGVYARIQGRLAANALPTAIECVHEDDLLAVVSDLSDLLADNLAANEDGREGRGYMRVLTRQASERIGKAMPDQVLAWCEALGAHLRRRPDDKEIADFAWSLLPGCALADTDFAARYLGHLLDWHVEVTAHDSMQVNVPHLWIGRAMGLPRTPAIDEQLERLIVGSPDDDTLWLIVDTALASERRDWLELLVRRELVGDRVGRMARARYLAALAGLPIDPFDVGPSALLSAVERRAVRIEGRRARFDRALAAWRRAEDADARFAAETELFGVVGRYVIDTSTLSRDEGLAALLASRLARAQSDGHETTTASFLGLALPPAWMILANVPPRLLALAD